MSLHLRPSARPAPLVVVRHSSQPRVGVRPDGSRLDHHRRGTGGAGPTSLGRPRAFRYRARPKCVAALDAEAELRGVNLVVSVVDGVAVIGGPVPNAAISSAPNASFARSRG